MNSNTAKRLGINNWTNDPEIWSNLHALVDNILDPAREKLGRAIYISSGYRSKEVNIAVGGAKNSQHMSGMAVDCYCSGSLMELFNIFRQMDFDQLILYKSKRNPWIHVSYTTKRQNRRQVIYS